MISLWYLLSVRPVLPHCDGYKHSSQPADTKLCYCCWKQIYVLRRAKWFVMNTNVVSATVIYNLQVKESILLPFHKYPWHHCILGIQLFTIIFIMWWIYSLLLDCIKCPDLKTPPTFDQHSWCLKLPAKLFLMCFSTIFITQGIEILSVRVMESRC